MPAPSPELFVRPFQRIDSSPVLRTPQAPAEVDPLAFIRWGAQSEFNSSNFRADAQNVGFSTETDDKPPKRKRYNYSEEGFGWKDWRIENEHDPEQYVVMRVATALAYSGPDGAQFVFNFDPSMPGKQEGEGQTPPTPPLNEIGETG
jgi:hypothetical protein